MRKAIIGNATLYLGDCLTVLPTLAADVLITDPPYGMTEHSWDVEVPPKGWMVAKGCVCFAAEPFTTRLINQAPLPFKYDLIWDKKIPTTRNCNIRPARAHEQILVFGDVTYTPQMTKRTSAEMSRLDLKQRAIYEHKSPTSVLRIDALNHRSGERTGHPSQKPVELMRWLVSTYSHVNNVVLDPFMGTGSTGVAALKLARKFVGIESNEEYFDRACDRVELAQRQERLFA